MYFSQYGLFIVKIFFISVPVSSWRLPTTLASTGSVVSEKEKVVTQKIYSHILLPRHTLSVVLAVSYLAF